MEPERRRSPRFGGDLGVLALPFLVGPSMVGFGVAHLVAGTSGGLPRLLAGLGVVVALAVDGLAHRWLPSERRGDLRAVLGAARVSGPAFGLVVGLVVYAILSGRI
ncbi:MAG: hypothetical protein U0230_16165 [Polyangiales bacterium]